MRNLIAAAALALAPWAMPAQAKADDMIRASCTQQGMTVYREDFPADAPAEKRVLIAAQHPGAMCVFLDASGRAGAAGMAVGETPAVEGMGDSGLAAALAVISSGETGKAYPKEFNEAMSAAYAPVPKPSGSVKPSVKPSEGYVTLTVGLYRDMAMADVREIWKQAQVGTKLMSRYTPTFNVLDGGTTVVSVERVPDSVAAEFCEEAALKSSGCVAVY